MCIKSIFPACLLALFFLVFPVMAQTSLEIGQPAPSFDCLSTTGKNLTLNDFKGKWLVLYFYPKAFTPGCTAESCSLRDNHGEIKKLGAEILGVSLDGLETQIEFKKKYQLPFELLADAEKKVGTAYGVLGFLSLYAKRKTFIIDPDGKLAHIFDSVTSASHDEEVLKILKQKVK